jgi:HK97 family phage portal protein
LLQAYRTSPWLHAVVHKIAYEVASVELSLHRKVAASESSLKARRRTRAAGDMGDAVEVERHEALDLLRRPNPVMTGSVLRYLVAAYLDVKGEAVLVLERNAAGRPVELWVVPPHWLMETPSRSSPFFRFSFGAWQRTLPTEDVVWLRHPDLEQPYGRGVGTGETLADEIDIDEFATKHLKNWFFNRALPDVFLYVEGVKSESEAQRYEEKLRAKHGGVAKAGQVHVTNGKVDIKQVGHTFREMLLPELRDQSRDTVLQIFSVPPEVMGIIENSNRATIDASFYLFARGVLVPRLAFICDGLTSWVRQEWGDDALTLGFDNPVPDDEEFRLRVMQAQPSLFTKNEWREMAGARPIEGWDEEFPSASPFALQPGPAPQPEASTPKPSKDDDKEDEEEEDDVVPEEDGSLDKAQRGRSLRRSVTPEDVRRVAGALKPERLLRDVTPELRLGIQAWGARVLRELGSAVSFDVRNPLIADYLDAWKEQRVVGITDTTRAEVTDVLMQAVKEGVGIDEMTRRLRGYFEDAASYRAERIARTEVVSSSNAANLAAYQLSGLVDAKEWLAVQDAQTRETHAAMDGQRRGLNEEFVSPSGARTQGPGLFGVGAEDINCRCTVRPVLNDAASPQGEARAAEWRAYVESLGGWEKSVTEAAARTFGGWLGDAISALLVSG